MKPFQINLIHFTRAKKETISNLLVTTLDTVQSNKLHTRTHKCTMQAQRQPQQKKSSNLPSAEKYVGLRTYRRKCCE
jgi:hypothetical protein